MTEEEENAKALNNVDTYGCHVLGIMAEGDLPPFTYSIGIEATSHQPDLLIIGLNNKLGHWIINEYNRLVRDGAVFVPNKLYEGFLEGFPVLFSPMLKEHYREYLGWGRWFYQGDNFRVFQLIYPDTTGKWPWNPIAASDFGRWQPLVSELPLIATH